MSISGTSWEKIEIKRIPSIPDGPDLPNGPKRPRKLIPAVFDPRSADADSDGWRQEGTTARWYGLLPSNPIYKNVLANFKKIKDPERDKSWLPLGHENLEEWLGTIEKIETPRLKAPAVELSTLEADLSFVAGQIDLRARMARERGVDAPNIANDSRRAAAWVKGREIQRRRLGKSEQVLGDDSMSALEKAEALIDELKKKRIERDKKIAKFAELDDYTKELIKKFNLSDFIVPNIDDYDAWSEDWKADNPIPIRGDYATEELFQDAIDAWQTRMDLDYEDAKVSQENNEELNDYLDQIFSFEYTAESGRTYSISFQYADQVTENSLVLSFAIYTQDDQNGLQEYAGYATRVLNLDEGTVYNDNLRILEQFRGDQISTALGARNEQIFALFGATEIEVSAASGQSMNGATHWPKVGFNWKDAGERHYFISEVEAALDYFAAEIKDNPDALPMVSAIRNGQQVQIPLFASREEAEMVMSLVKRAQSEKFADDDALTAGDLVNWSGAEFWFMNRSVIVSLIKPIGPSSLTGVKWLMIESETKAVNKPNKPNLPNAPNKPSIGGGKPSASRALKPAVFDPRSVDVDNDGWHQEGTTAAWFGAGLNNPIVQQLKEQMEKLTDDDADSSMEMARSGTWGLYEGAPKVEDSTDEADLAWLGGRILQQQQQPSGMFGGPPPRGMTSSLESEAQWLHGRQKIRERGGIREEVIPTPKIEQLKDEDVVAVLEKTATARKERRAILDAKTRVRSDDAVTEEVRTAARDFDYTKYPADTDVELLEYEEWKEKYVEEPEIPDYPIDGTAEEREAWEQAQRDYLDLMAGKWDEYIEYKRAQEDLQSAELKKALAPLFEFEFTASDGKTYSTKVDRVTQDIELDDDGNEIAVFTAMGKFYNEDGLEVGVFTRSFAPEKKLVMHEHLKLEPEARGSQISGIFNSRNEIIYREMGYDTISVGALSSGDYNGATHWPKVGFDWANEDEREAYLRVVEDALTEFAVAIKSDPDALPMLAKITEDADGNPITTEVPIFASREEAESVALLIALAREQDFDDPSRLTSGDFVNWPGAERWFQQRSHQAELSRSLGEIEDVAQGADAPDADAPNVDAPDADAPNVDASSEGMSAEQIKEKNERIFSELEAQGGAFGRIDEEYKKTGGINGEPIVGAITQEESKKLRMEAQRDTFKALRYYFETGEPPMGYKRLNGLVLVDDPDYEESAAFPPYNLLEGLGFERRHLEAISPELRKLIMESTDEELDEIITRSAVAFHEDIDRSEISVQVPVDRIDQILDDGVYRTTHEVASSKSGPGDRARVEAERMGIPRSASADIRPASGYIVTKSHMAAAERAWRETIEGDLDPLEKQEFSVKNYVPEFAATEVDRMYGDIRVVLRPEVADRTAYSFGDTIKHNPTGVTLLTEDDPEVIANNLVNVGNLANPHHQVLKLLQADLSNDGLGLGQEKFEGDADFARRRLMDDMRGLPFEEAGPRRIGSLYFESTTLGGFELTEVGKVYLPPKAREVRLDLLSEEAKNSVVDEFLSADALRARGLSEEEIAYVQNILNKKGLAGVPGADSIQRILELRKAKELEKRFSEHGIEVFHQHPSSLNILDPLSYAGGKAGDDPEELLKELGTEKLIEKIRADYVRSLKRSTPETGERELVG